VTRVTADVDELAGVVFPDPYRWLEGAGPEVQRWQDEQGAEAAAYVRDWPHFDRLRVSVARCSTARFEPLPRWRNVGHGWATDKDIAITEHTQWLALQLGMQP
jgi:hypothetical protein